MRSGKWMMGLVAAADNVVAKKPNASAELKAAANCKECHKVHQDDE